MAVSWHYVNEPITSFVVDCRYFVCSAWQRRSSLHERRDSLSLREMREESQRLQESMLLSVNTEEDEDEKPLELPVTVVRAHYCQFTRTPYL